MREIKLGQCLESRAWEERDNVQEVNCCGRGLGSWSACQGEAPIGALVRVCQPSTNLITQVVCGGLLDESVIGVDPGLYPPRYNQEKPCIRMSRSSHGLVRDCGSSNRDLVNNWEKVSIQWRTTWKNIKTREETLMLLTMR